MLGCTALYMVVLCHGCTNLKKFYKGIKNKDCFLYFLRRKNSKAGVVRYTAEICMAADKQYQWWQNS